MLQLINMKKLLGIVVLGLFLSSNAYAKDLTGTKLICKSPKEKNYRTISIDFIDAYEAIRFEIKEWKLSKRKLVYIVEPDQIRVGMWITIDRETLTIGYGTTPCEIVDKDFDLDLHMQNILNDHLKEQESKNKI